MYQIVSASSPEALAFKVNEAMSEGWAPTGGVFSAHGYTYFQAMVKKGEDDE